MSQLLSAAGGFVGRLVGRGDVGFEAAREVFNERCVGRPLVIAQCAGVGDVRAAFALARDRGLEVAVRCGGHSVAGWSSVDGGLVIDLTLMREVEVDGAAGTAWVGGGARAVDVIVKAGEFGLVPVTGATPTVGLGGLLLGLGEGYLSPKFGFGVDNVLALELVTVDGRVLRASPDERPDLFWAMRGAGPNFGVVTRMKLRLHPVPERAVGGSITFGASELGRVTRHLWEVMERGSEHYWPHAVYGLDDAGRPQVTVIPGHTGPVALAEREVGELRRCGRAVSDTIRAMSYPELIDEMAPPVGEAAAELPRRRVWDPYLFAFGDAPERQMQVLLEQTGAMLPGSYFNLWRTVPMPAPVPSAAPRDPGIAICLISTWRDADDDDRHLDWIRRTADAFDQAGVVEPSPNAMNHVSAASPERVRRTYGAAGYRRLTEIKAEYDPENILHRNFNIPPAR